MAQERSHIERERFEELCIGYTLDALDDRELGEFFVMTRRADAEMLGFLRRMQSLALHLPASVPAVAPPPMLRERVLHSIVPRKAPKKPSLSTRIASLLRLDHAATAFAVSFALIALLVVLAFLTLSTRQRLADRENEVVALQNRLATEQQRFTALESEYQKEKELLAVLQSPRIDMVTMNGMSVNPSGYGKIIWDPATRTAILQLSNVPPVPAGKDYQLWVIKDHKHMSAGVFAVTPERKNTFFKIDRLVETNKRAIDAFAITLEPKGGMPQPTGAMYLMGRAKI